MYNLMMTKQDHYLHMRKALLSTTEFVFIHTAGKATVDAPVALVTPSRPSSEDAYGNVRHYYPAEKFDEVSLRLAFEQGWEEQEYVPYSKIQNTVAAEKAIPKISDSMKDVKKQAENFSKLLEDIAPTIQKVEKALAAKKAWQHTHWAIDNKYSYHNPETIEYSQPDYFVSAQLYDQQIKPTPVTMKDFYEATKGCHNDTIAGELAATAKYDTWLEKKYSIVVQVFDDGYDGMFKIVVLGINGYDMYKSQYLVGTYHSFYEVQEKVILMKKEVIEHLQDKEQGVIF